MRCRSNSSFRCARARHPLRDQQQLLVANALAQGQALLVGRHDDALRAELGAQGYAGTRLEAAIAARRCPGDRASTTILLPELDARNLGALLALYEHRTFVEATLYGINPFDQWGVELGKTLAEPVAAALAGDAHAVEGADASTRLLIERARSLAAGGGERNGGKGPLVCPRAVGGRPGARARSP